MNPPIKSQSHLRLVALLAVVLLASCHGHAQTNETYAIKGGTVVTVTGATIPNGVVVIRNGLIMAVGADVTIPGDARIVDATGMMVYPGLIDAYSSYGLRPPAPPTGGAAIADPQTAILAALSAPPSSVGLLPEVTVTDQLQISAETFDPQRSVGITAALTSPRDGIFRGQSAFINLGNEASEKLLLKAPHSLSIAFSNGGGFRSGSPNSGMGVFAFLRQSFMDAQHYRDEWDWYSKSPRGKARPNHNKSLAALVPVVSGRMPVILNANSEREIRRAVALAEEYNLKYLLAGAAQSYEVADYLKTKNVTVLLSLSFPQKPANLEDPESESLRTLQERANAPKAAAALHKAGVKFAFASTTLMRPADFIANAARTIEAGLPKDEALKALTINPAQIFPPLDRYYADCVIGGEGAFALPVASVGDLGEAILMKLLRELLAVGGHGNDKGRVISAAAEPPTDCLAGEKERARRTDQYYPELDR